MIVGSQHFILDYILEPFQIDYKSGDWVWIAGNCDFEGVIVTVTIAAGAAAKDSSFFSCDQASFQ